jgi:hypothetical protein
MKRMSENPISSILKMTLLPKNLFQVQWGSESNDQSWHRCVAVQFPGPQITINKHKQLHSLSISDYKPAEQVTLTFLESADMEIYKYHQEWMNLFYNKDTLRYQSAPLGSSITTRQRDCKILVAQNGAFSEQEFWSDSEPHHVIEIEGMIPEGLPNLDFSFGASDYIQYSITYKINDWKIKIVAPTLSIKKEDKARYADATKRADFRDVRRNFENVGLDPILSQKIDFQTNILTDPPLKPKDAALRGPARSLFRELGL